MEAFVNEKAIEIKENKEKLDKIFNSSPDAIAVFDLNGKIIECNQAKVSIYGFSSKDELIGKSAFELISPKEQQKALLRMGEVSKTGLLKNYEYTALTKDGREFPAESTAGILKDAGGNPIGFVSITKDITERKKSEAKLLASEKKYRRLFENLKRVEKQLLEERDRAQNYLDIAGVMLVALDTEGRIAMLNRKGCEILRCTAEEALGKNWFDNFLPNKVKNAVKRHFRSILAGKANFPKYHENPVLAKNGDIRLIWWHNTVLKNNNGQIIGTLSSGEDITEWKKAQQALTDNEEKFRAISTYASDAILLLDKTDKVIYWNLAAEKIFGYTKEEAIGKKLAKLVVPPRFRRAHIELLKKVLEPKGNVSEKRLEVPALRKDGTEFPIELTVSALKLKDAPCILEIIRDISERKKMEDARKQERDMLEAVTENLGAGLTIVSRDYRILWANKFLKQVYGDVEHKLCYVTYEQRNEVCPNCGAKKVLEDGAAYDVHETTIRDEKGNTQWIELIVTPIKDKDGTIIAALELAVNVTERKLVENKLAKYSKKLKYLVKERTEQLKQTQAKLVESERLAAIGELAAMVGHDLRNPLTGIKGATYYLKTKHCAEIDAKGKEILETIDKAIDYSNKILSSYWCCWWSFEGLVWSYEVVP